MPRVRVPMSTDNDDGWTETACDGCATGRIAFDPDGEQRDGATCDGCELMLCDACGRLPRWRADDWTSKPHEEGVFCIECLAKVEHDEATCKLCEIDRARSAKFAAEQAERRRAEQAAAAATVWPRMLCCVRGITMPRAEAIAEQYPSASRLVEAYADARKRGISETALLADVRMPNGKRIGPAASAAIHRALVKD